MCASRIRLFIFVVVVLLVCTSWVPAEQGRGGRKRTKPKLDTVICETISQTLDQLEKDHDFAKAEEALSQSFDQVIAFAQDRDRMLFRDAACARRLVSQLAKADEKYRISMLQYLRANPHLARSLIFAMKPKYDQPEKVFAILERLRQARGDKLDRYATLTAALCIVHDEYVIRTVNENSARAPDPLVLFDYYTFNEKRMFFGLRDVPAELLMYVVDCAATIDDMVWALDRYAGDRNVGARFFDIDYDYDHVRKGQPKKVTVAGWNLPNILHYGGVCADQAYFAVTIGKSIGVPTTYTRGQSANASHAWVGFLETDGRRAWWNFNTGRYPEYQGVRGVIHDPQTRQSIPDSHVSLMAEFVHADELDRHFAAAVTDAAHRLVKVEQSGEPFMPPSPIENESKRLREPTLKHELALLEVGLRACPGYRDGWTTVRDLSAEGCLSLDDKKKWATVVHRLCGRWYPDFYLSIVTPMIETVGDVEEQNRLWNAAFGHFSHRHDLAATVRMNQASMWRENGDIEKVGQCYEDIINRYTNAGPFVISALREAEKILRDKQDGRRLLMLYDRAWSQIEKPETRAGIFARMSNWYQIGYMYASVLDEAGMHERAASIRQKVNSVVSTH